jgi:hypothetical protein
MIDLYSSLIHSLVLTQPLTPRSSGRSLRDTEEGSRERQQPVTRDKEEKMLRDALLRRRLKEIVELAEADPLYGVSREEAMRRAAARVAEKYGRPADRKKDGTQ